ncbi:acylphosphatase [bacterium]|nr:acylphosphatase [bacterium]
MERIDITVTGRVQGVAFRHHTRLVAERLGLVGWVRNQPDGSVWIMAEGPRERLEQLLNWAADGPEHAVVSSCDHEWHPATGDHDGFRVTG